MHDPDIEAARAGDVRAFERIFIAHHRTVYALATRMTSSETDAMDVAQDTFVTAWHRLATFRGDSTASTWLCGIAIRHAMRARRRLGRMRRREEAFASEGESFQRPPLAESCIDLERAIASLPLRMRAAVVLHCVHGYTQAEAARMMGVAEGTVKAHVHKGRQLLRERLGR